MGIIKNLEKSAPIIFGKEYNALSKVLQLKLKSRIELVEWVADDNVVRINGTIRTQDANYRNRIKDYDELEKYFLNHIIN